MTSSPTPAVLPDARAQSQAFWDAAQECLRVGEETEFAADVTEEYRKGYKAACKIMSMPLQHMSSRAARGLPWNDTPPASDAAVPAGAWRPFVHQRDVPTDGTWFVARSTKPGYAATRVVRYAGKSDRLPIDESGEMWPSEPTEWMPLDEFAAAPKVASDTGAGETVNVAADAILADVRNRRLLKLLFQEDANTNAAPVGWIDAPIDLETQRECATAWARLALAAAPKMASGTEAASRIERVAQAIYKASGSLIDQNGFIPWSAVDGTTDADSYRRMAAAAIATLRASDTGAGLPIEITADLAAIGLRPHGKVLAWADPRPCFYKNVSPTRCGHCHGCREQDARDAALATPTDATDGATGGGEAMARNLRDALNDSEELMNGDVVLTAEHAKQLNADIDAWEAAEPLSPEDAWDQLVNVDDRTSPEEYPDMCLITRDEVFDFMQRATTPGGDLLEQAARVEALEQRGAELVIAYHVAICTPKGIVPDDRFYDPDIAAKVQASLDAGIPVRAFKPAGDGGEA